MLSPELDRPWGQVIELIFRSCIEDGSIEVGDKEPKEILSEFGSIINHIIDSGDTGFVSSIDHREDLIRRAKKEDAENKPEMAVTFYALWLEHTVNASLIDAFQCKGYDLFVIMPLIRELRLGTKITALWNIAGYPPLSEDDVRTIEQVTQARNAFVHYKWSPRDEEAAAQNRATLKRVIERAQTLEETFSSAVNLLIWNGREDEIISYFRDDYRQRQEQNGPFTLNVGPTREPPKSPPSS